MPFRISCYHGTQKWLCNNNLSDFEKEYWECVIKYTRLQMQKFSKYHENKYSRIHRNGRITMP